MITVVRRRSVLIVLALLDLVTIVGYFALAGLHGPAARALGVGINVLQVIVLGGPIY